MTYFSSFKLDITELDKKKENRNHAISVATPFTFHVQLTFCFYVANSVKKVIELKKHCDNVNQDLGLELIQHNFDLSKKFHTLDRDFFALLIFFPDRKFLNHA